MKSTLKNMVLSLFGITLISSACVGVVNMVTAEKIQQAKEQAIIDALSGVLPEFDTTEKSKYTADQLDIVAHKASLGGQVVGYAIETASKSGFSGLIRLMVGFDTNGTILNVNVLEQAETPGLGAKMTEVGNPLLASIQGKEASRTRLTVKKDGGDIDALTAATISSRAYAEAVARAYSVFKVVAGWEKEVQATTGATNTNGGEKSNRGGFEPKRGKE